MYLDTKKLNPNLEVVQENFNRRLDRFFDAEGNPRLEFFEEVACYNCQTASIASEFVIGRFRHVRCARCKMVYVSPRLRATILHDSYMEEEHTNIFRLKLIPSLEYRREVVARRKFEQVAAFFDNPGRIIDIGCGLGDILSLFDENGWEVLGIEYNEFAASFAREHFGVSVSNSSIYDYCSAGATYDVAMLWGVLEHFVEPQRILAKVHSLLRPGGLLVIEVPSGDSFLVRYYEKYQGYLDRIIEGDRHLMLFSARALREMVERAGFQLSQLQSNGLDIDTLTRLNDEQCSPEFIARLQSVLDAELQGDLLRGFWRRNE